MSISVYTDLGRWGRKTFEFSGVDDFIGSPIESDGVYRIKMSDGNFLDLLIANTDLLKSSAPLGAIGVCMTGAVFPRNGKLAPFFSGLSILKDTNALVISISDPSLALSEVLNLGWYSGYKGNTELPSFISKLLDLLSKKMDAKVVLYGGSGGGFASLLISSLMIEEVYAFVWNPQTSISQYKYGAVRQYCEEAFGVGLSKDQESNETVLSVLDSLGITHCLQDIEHKDNAKVIYLQNTSDEHTFSHMLPFVSGRELESIGGGSIYADHLNRLYIAVGNWGEGHAVPPKVAISKILLTLINEDDILNCLSDLSSDLDLLHYDKINSNFFGSLESSACTAFFQEERDLIKLSISDRAPVRGARIRYRVNFCFDRQSRLLVRFKVQFKYYNPKYQNRIKYGFGSSNEKLVIDSSLWVGEEDFLLCLPCGVDKYLDIEIFSTKACEDWNWGRATELSLKGFSIEETKMEVAAVSVSTTHPFISVSS